jgi:hypothetical protein
MMSINNLLVRRQLPSLALLWAVSFLFCAPKVLASSVNIVAEFKPDFTRPGSSGFIDKTPVSGHCAIYNSCASRGLTTVYLPYLETNYISIPANHGDPRQGAIVRISPDVKEIELSGPDGAIERLGFNISHYAIRYTTRPWATTITGIPGAAAHDALWENGGWLSAPAGCQIIEGYRATAYVDFLYSAAAGAHCAKMALYTIPSFRFEMVSIGYKMDFPNPLHMRNGTYRGSATYYSGPGKDIDFGDVSASIDSELVFEFVLQVHHALRISVSPGAENVSLKPPLGWGAWTAHSVGPDKLVAEQKFEISTSGDFKIQLKCQYLMGSQCAIANPVGHQVPVETLVTLPAGLTMAGAPINRQVLSVGSTVEVSAARYMESGHASLDFEVDQKSVTEMLSYRGSTYNGDVTIVWDSNI